MQIREIMTTPVISVHADTPLDEVADLMRKHNIGSLPVCDAQENLVGLITDRDIVTRSVADGQDPKSMRTEQVMTTQVETVNPTMDVSDVSKIMAVKQIRRMPVTENNKVVGMVVLGDMAATPNYEMEAARALSEISEMPKEHKNRY
jgi:CBS domain-containing protein